MFNTFESLLGLSFCTWKVFTAIVNYLPDMIKLKLMDQAGTGGLQSFKVNLSIRLDF